MHAHRDSDPTSDFQFMELHPTCSSRSEVAIVHLHGSGERGDDLALVTRYGLPAAIVEGRAFANCPVICPQLEAQAEWEPQRVAAFVRTAKERFSRIALIGYSWGASGVCSALGRFGPIADVHIAISGQAPGHEIARQDGTEFLAIQGELDTWPSTSHFVPIINDRGGRAMNVVLPGLGHYISEEATNHPACNAMLGSIGIAVTFRYMPADSALTPSHGD